jgi:hypothetical protein
MPQLRLQMAVLQRRVLEHEGKAQVLPVKLVKLVKLALVY